METITFRCTTCQLVLKVGADKAGRSAKCSKCGATLKIPAKTPAAPPPPPDHKTEEAEDKAYKVMDTGPADDKRGQPEVTSPTPKVKAPGRALVKRQAAISNPEEWRKVGMGSRVIAGGLCLLLAAHVIYRVPLVAGLVAGEEYAAAAERLAPASGGPTLDLCTYAVGVVAGGDSPGLMVWLVRFAFLLQLLQCVVLVAGYLMCLIVPNRFGTRMQLNVLLGLAALNGVLLVAFKLLPMFGVYSYTLLPFAVPEIALVEMAAERAEPILAFWLKWPTLEAFASILLTILLYLEPALIATFLYALAKSIKSEPLQANAYGAMLLGFSQIYIQIVWFMAALSGSSVVLVWILRLIYTLALAFFVYQLILTAKGMFSVPAVVELQLGDDAAAPSGAEEAQDEEEPEEDEE